MLVIRQKFINRCDLQDNPDILYVFGDNLFRVGMGGQAAEMRGEPNAFGIATKKTPSHNPEDFFRDNKETMLILEREFQTLRVTLKQVVEVEDDLCAIHRRNKWKAVVIPTDGIGTGLSKMPQYCPKALEYIEEQFKLLEDL